ncbi:MAG TPA: hypothetical protein VK658_21705 [Chryseolinea sp.]|nr:hypothetical protein [Chryseolinea sp.]
MKTILKYLLCICVLVSGVYTLCTTYAHGLEGEPGNSGKYLRTDRVTLNVSDKDGALFSRFAWLNREKSANTFHIPFLEQRENEEDESHSFDRFGAVCITSIFLAIVCGRALADALAASDGYLHYPALSNWYLILQVFRI